MGLSVFNYLTRRQELFKPITPGFVGMYVCGPTVYDDSHLGHAKVYVSFDVVHRYLRFLGYKVRYVQNITDVGHLLDSGQDRIELGATREKLEPMEIVEKYTASYLADMDALGVKRPSILPRASGHIPEQIELIERLLDRGIAYETGGSVYFAVEKHPSYGRLARRNLDELLQGARVDTRDEKRSPLDFALWKKADPEHLMKWRSPWGIGYPGWHIECSAMSAKYLGLPYDIHGGGIDNIFPHNESEIAQAEGAYGEGYANYWLLAGTLTVDNVKMSKSLGNFITIKEALRRTDPLTLRVLVLTGNYRSPLAYSQEALESAQNGARRLTIAREKLSSCMGREGTSPTDDLDQLTGELGELRDRFVESMNDDFNTPKALGVMFEIAHRANRAVSSSQPVLPEVQGLDLLFRKLGDEILGLSSPTAHDRSELVQTVLDLVVEMREELRKAKIYQLADDIRTRLSQAGVALEDGPDGTSWRLER